jgi:hypothetical protein
MARVREGVGLLLLMVMVPVYGQTKAQSQQSPRLSHTPTQAEERALQGWLAKHAEYRVARDEDCECLEDIKQLKTGAGGVWKPVPDYHPYFATGDFNGDGIEDFAAVVVEPSKKQNNFALLVFNGPFESGNVLPAFFKAGLDLTNQGLFYGPPRPKPYRLIVGRFESDTGSILLPRGRSYTFNE